MIESPKNIELKLKKRDQLLNFTKKSGNRFLEFVRDQDMFGETISLNFKGKTSFQTLPGGFLSITIKFVLLWYSFL